MKLFLISFLLSTVIPAVGQVIADFENFNLERGSYINNASPANSFESGSIVLPNDYNEEFGVWSGFAISADTNTTTPGFLNQYSAITGNGAEGSTAYAMGYIFDPLLIHLKEQAIGKPMIGMYVTNSTYSYLSMRDGDAFAKKFGGESGKDPDYFFLTVKKYAGGVLSDDSIDVYLADYRSSDPSKDFILSDWKYIDLTVLGQVDSLVLRLTSSDVGIFGMNTPAYVAIDEVSTDNLLAASAAGQSSTLVRISPNPASETLYLQISHQGTYNLTSIQGIEVWSEMLTEGFHQINVNDFPSGLYFLTCKGEVLGKVCLE